MRVLHVIPSLSPRRGGATAAALAMVKALTDNGAEVEIATTNDHGDDTLDVPLNTLVDFAGANVRFFNRYSPKLSALREFAYSREFRHWLRRNIERYDLIHVHALFSFTSTYAMYCARRLAVPYVAHPIGSLDDWSLQQGALKKKLYLRLIEKKNLLGASSVHFTAESERSQAMSKIAAITPIVIPLGLTVPRLANNARETICRQYNLQEDIPILLFLSRIHEKKGLHLLIDAIAEIKDQKFHLLIAGEGSEDYKSQLQQQILTRGLDSDCQFLGYVSGQQKAHLLEGADLFVLPSSSENFGIAVLEASSYATAVLVGPGVALSEPTKKYQFGLVCDNSEDSLASALSQLVEQRSALRDMGLRGREYVKQHHQWSSIARRLIDAYRQIVSTTPI